MTDEVLSTDLSDIRKASRDRARATREAIQMDQLWRGLIRNAVASGKRVADVAEAAEISRERVYQIRDGRR